ncbi:hypothetical protein NQ317_012644 [Molorchus minor]|uniref:Nuclear pore complex protein n=1 Tax=Molorchus minor TaxID=1323400 RepID=A0ABQ9J137_9CUCU|nr:hypothetical protein NQ317_012644 [Molorchus minor]
MDNALERSLHLLENALSPSERGLFKKKGKFGRDPIDFSFTVAPHELKKILEGTGSTFYIDDTIRLDRSFAGNVSQSDGKPWKSAIDRLYTQFFEILQSHSGGYDILDIVSDLSRCCSDSLKVIQQMKSTVSCVKEESWLRNEAITWRLIFILYQDRLLSQNLMDEGITQYCGQSEEMCIQNLFKRDNLIRESQLIIDWLEYNAMDTDYKVLHFSDNTVSWENTLHQLQSADTIAFGSSRQIVTEMDPDAPHVQHKPLHDLDVEDEKKAQKLCRQYGHPWKAAIFEGWRLFHNPNVKENFGSNLDLETGNKKNEEMEPDAFHEIKGNSNRDIWKRTYCGYIPAVLPICSSWEDCLWAYLKCMVDIRVESEIRDNCIRNEQYISLPEEYWMQRISLNEIFDSLEKSKSANIKEESFKPERVVQKFIILDEIQNLLLKIKEWIEDPRCPTYFLRFLAHLVLFFDQIGEGHDRNTIEDVLEVYIKHLMEINEAQLIAYYVSKLSPSNQTHLYSQYLERITDTEERKKCLEYAENKSGNLQRKITETDGYKINALDWVFFYELQRAEALLQTNALIFTFLTMGKLDAAHLAFEKIPVDTVEKITSEGNLSRELNQTVKEYFGYKAYLDANEAFNDWFKQFQCKPSIPEELPENAQFPEKVAHQHKMSQYKAELERWKLTMSHLAKNAKTLLYNVLLFPEGWLIGVKDGEYLRSICIPEVVLLLYSILYESQQYKECLQLADIIASEVHCLYEVYSKEKLAEILDKLCEVSLTFLNEKKDPWGERSIASNSVCLDKLLQKLVQMIYYYQGCLIFQ